MAGINISGGHALGTSALLGGKSTTSGTVGPGFKKFIALFRRNKPPEDPKVKGGAQNGDLHRLKLSKSPATLDLARIFKTETGKAKAEAEKIKSARTKDPLPKDGLTTALQTLHGATASPLRDKLADEILEFGHIIDGFHADPLKSDLRDGTPITLAEFQKLVDDYVVHLEGALKGENATVDGHVDAAIAQLKDLSSRIGLKLDASKPPLPKSPPPSSSSTQPPPETVDKAVTRLETKRDEIAKLADGIAKLQTTTTGTDKAGKWAERQASLTGQKLKAHAEINKALSEVNKLIAAHGKDPTKSTEVASLKALRSELTKLAVEVEFPGLLSQSTKLSKDGIGTALRGITNIPPQKGFDDGTLRLSLAQSAKNIEAFIDGINAGHDPVEMEGGLKVGIAEFATTLEKFMSELESSIAPGRSLEYSSAIDAAVRRLAQLSREVAAHIAMPQALEALEKLQTVPSPKLSDVDKQTQTNSLGQITDGELLSEGLTKQDIDPKGRSGSEPPSLGALLRAMGTALPSLNIDPENATVSQRRNALEALSTFSQLIVDGDPPDMLLGHSPALDASLLAIKQERAAGDTPPLTKQELIDYGKRRKAVALRQEMTILNRRLEGLLKVDRRVWYKPNTWGDNGRFFGHGGASSIRKDKVFIDALRNYGGSKTGREVAFLLARISDLESKTFALEKSALGLHEHLDVNTFKPIPPSGTQSTTVPTPSELLEHAGLSDTDIEKMGLSGKDRDDLGNLVVDLNRKGMGSVQEVRETTRAINKGINQVVRSELAQDTIGRFNQESTQSSARLLLNEMLVDAHLAQTGKLPTGHVAGTKDPDVVTHFKWQSSEAEKRIKARDQAEWDKLSTGADNYRDATLEIVTLLGDHAKVGEKETRYRELLKEMGKPEKEGGLGLDLDPTNPRGLESAHAIVDALEAHDLLETTHKGDADLIKKRDDALEKLKGFDATRMHRPWHQKVAAAFGRGSSPSIDDIARLRTAAQAIIYLREGASNDRGTLDKQIETQGKAMEGILVERMRDNPIEVSAVRQIIRTAVLASWPQGGRDFTMSKGQAVNGYDPASKRGEIEAQLKDWGVDVERFAPEIEQAIYGTLTLADVQRWSSETMFSPSFSRESSFKASSLLFGTESITGKRDMDEPTKRALISSLETMSEGGKLSLKAGNRVTLDTSKVPLDPTGANTLRVRLAGASLGHIEIERGSDGYKLHVRSGGEGKANVDYALGYKLTENVKAEVGAGVEGSVNLMSGVSLTFKPDEAGRKSLIELLGKMIDEKDIGVSDWSSAIDVAMSSEGIVKGSATGRAVMRAELMTPAPSGDKYGVGAMAELAVTAGISGKSTDMRSQREYTHKGEVEVSGGVTLNTAVYERLFNAVNALGGAAATGSGASIDKNYDVSGTQNTDLVSLSVGVVATYTQKWKQVHDDQGFYTKAEVVRQTNLNVDRVKSMMTISNDDINAKIEKDKEFGDNLAGLLAHMGQDDFLAVTYNLKSDALLEANTLLDQVKSLKREGKTEQARELEAMAKKIIDNSDNYTPAKISLVMTKTDKSEVTNLNSRWLKWDVFSDGKLEHAAIVLNVPA